MRTLLVTAGVAIPILVETLVTYMNVSNHLGAGFELTGLAVSVLCGFAIILRAWPGRHLSLVAIIYLPLMSIILFLFSFALALRLGAEPP
jgi:hypothetical protein